MKQRKPLSKSLTVSIRLEPEDDVALEKLSQATDIKRTALIRMCARYVLRYIDKHRAFPEGFISVALDAPLKSTQFDIPKSQPYILNEPPPLDPEQARKSTKN